MKFSIKPWFGVAVLGLAMLFTAVSVTAQDADKSPTFVV